MSCWFSGVETVDGDVQVYNHGEPCQPGWSVKICCCIPMVTLTGIPEGTPRVPAEEEQAILKRWYGHWRIINLSAPIGPKSVFFTDAFIDGNLLGLSGGVHYETEWSHNDYNKTSGNFDVYISTAVANSAQKQRLSFWRGEDGTLYIDNIGSYVVSESPTELRFKNALNIELAFTRQGAMIFEGAVVAASDSNSSGVTVVPSGAVTIVGQSIAAPMQPVMDRGPAQDYPAEIITKVRSSDGDLF